VIALEVSSAAGPPPWGGIGGSIRQLVAALVRLDPDTRYALAYRPSRLRQGDLFRPAARNTRIRVVQDPCNAVLLRGTRVLHGMSSWLPRTPAVPKLVTIYDVNPLRNPAWVTERWRALRGGRMRQAVERADCVVATSRHAAGEIEALLGVPAARIRVAPLGVDAACFRPLEPEARATLRARYGDFVLAVGLVSARKNVERLVEAVAKVPELRLLVVGRPSNAFEAFRAAVARTKTAERVEHRGRVSERELVELLGAARLVAVPSLYEGFGLTVLEAMACGTPVVCSDATSLPEVAGGAALLVDARDAEALADAIRRVLASPALASELVARGLARARAMSWERAARELLPLYRELGAGSA